MITKEPRLGKIQILDEREPWAAQHGQTIVRWSMLLMENGRQVGQLEDYATMLTPDTDHTAWAPSDSVFTSIGFTPPTAEPKARVSALCVADHTPGVRARWKVTRSRQELWRLKDAQAQQALLIEAQAQFETAQAELAALEGPLDLTLHQETRFNLAEILSDGQIQVRLRKCICENGAVISPPQYHRIVLQPGGNHGGTLAMINPARARDEGAPALSQRDIDRIVRICATDHTLGRITAWQAAEAARRRP